MTLRRVDLRAGLPPTAALRTVLPRAGVELGSAMAAVTELVEDVRTRGAAAVLDASERFDNLRPASLRVPAGVIRQALAAADPAVRDALTESIARARRGHAAQLPTDVTTELAPGGVVRQRWVPVSRVGLYVPGGLALYPSSVVMNVVPAQVAGVGGIAVTSPPQKNDDPELAGWPDPNVLVACALLGIDEVYAVGGAQAIALLGYGAVDVGDADGTLIEPVDVITGPGNVYVTAAKRLLAGTVAIDSTAGPTEIAVIADDSAEPDLVAADLISQAEHDPLAAAVLITDSPSRGRRGGRGDRRPAAGGQAPPAGDGGADRTAVRDRAGRVARRRRRGGQRLRGRAPGDPDGRTRTRSPTGSSTPARSSSGRSRRCPSGTTAPGPTTCCRPAAAHASRPG